MKKQDLSTIMRRAWHIARATGKAFAVCLSKAVATLSTDEADAGGCRSVRL